MEVKSFKEFKENYIYHKGNLDLNNIKPYYSDNIFIMQGRGTGHFGSGIYFCTYRVEDKKIDDEYGKYSEYDYNTRQNKNLIKIKDLGIYRVNPDIYQNLYKPTGEKHAEFLFKTLRMCNNCFYSFYADYKDDKKITNDISSRYLRIKNNLEKLDLKIPIYKEFLKLLITACNDYETQYTKKKPTSIASFSTRIMEFNDFNGVNVSNIRNYDNTTHGSVIYDINKLSDKPVKINVDLYGKEIKDGIIGISYGNRTDETIVKLLSDKELSYLDLEQINKMTANDQLKYLKRYNNYIDKFIFYNFPFNDNCKKIYVNSLINKIKAKTIKLPNTDTIEILIDYGKIKQLFDVNFKFPDDYEYGTMLEYILAKYYSFNEEYREMILNNIDRELTKEEQYYFDRI